jgi:hypothetical protein
LAPPLPPDVAASLPPDLLDVGDSTVSLTLSARQMGTGTDEFLPGTSTAEEGPGLSVRSISRVPIAASSGDAEPLTDGIWEIFARWRAFGWTFSPPVIVEAQAPGADDPVGGPALLGPLPRLVRPHHTVRGNLRVELTGPSPAVPTTLPKLRVDRARSTASARDHEMTMDLTLRLETDQRRNVKVQVAQGDSEPAHVWPAVLHPIHSDEGGQATCRLSVKVADGRPEPGRWRLRVSPDDAAYLLPVACPLTVKDNGSVRLGRNPPRSYRAWVLTLLPAGVSRQLRKLRNGVRSARARKDS